MKPIRKLIWTGASSMPLIAVVVASMVAAFLVMSLGNLEVERPAWEAPPMPSAWECRTVVGDAYSTTRVEKCWDPDTDKCWYIATNLGGGMKMVETKCWVHPFQEVNQ